MDLGIDDIRDGIPVSRISKMTTTKRQILKLGRSALVMIPIPFSPISASIAKPSR
jgi:hypothetical protein